MARLFDGEAYVLKFRKRSLSEARKEAKKLKANGYKYRLVSADGGKVHEVWAKWGR